MQVSKVMCMNKEDACFLLAMQIRRMLTVITACMCRSVCLGLYKASAQYMAARR
jgi:hypothetical protein